MSAAGLLNGEPFAVRVEFLSDWACSTGTARHGAVDRAIQRDADDLPMLRGKTLAAMLRDAAETVAAGLDEGADLWQRWVDVIFGQQYHSRSGSTASALQARPLRLPGPVRAAIAAMDEHSRGLAREATVLLRPGVRIDAVTGVAIDDMLRIEERAAAGLTVTATWRLTFATIEVGSPVPWEAEFLILAAARMLDAIGGKRRRGAGRCRVVIAGGQERLTALLPRVPSARTPEQTIAPTSRASAEPLGPPSTRPLRHVCDLRITALTPVLVARGVIGTMVVTERFVPGAVLLPLVARALGSRATELITGGHIVITDATLDIGGQRSVPVPRALHRVKGTSDPELVNMLDPRADRGRRLQPAGGFCVTTATGLVIDEPILMVQAHAVVDDERQRPNEESGGLYTYEAITAGTVLRAQVWLREGTSLDEELLAGEHSIGRSKKDDYGHVRVNVTSPSGSPDVTQPVDELVVWLLSDVLLRGDAGQPTADATRLAVVLGDLLQVSLTLPDAAEERPSALLTTRRVESWQSRWSLPRPSLTGLAAGSVVRFLMRGKPSADRLRQVLAHGVGERTAEGFGRIAIHPRLLTESAIALAPRTDTNAASTVVDLDLSEQERRQVDSLLVRGWRRELHRQARTRAHDPQLRRRLVPDKVTATQRGTLRTLADRCAVEEESTALRAWIDGAKRNKTRAKAWGDERLSRLERLVTIDGDELWDLFDVRPPDDVARLLYLPALSWLLAGVARAEPTPPADRPATTDPQEVPA